MNISPAADQVCRILSFDPQARAGMDAITPGDWQPIVNLAAQQYLAPLLYQRIMTLGLGDSVPSEVLITLHNQYLHSAARGMWLVRQYDNILAGFNSAHLPVIPIKGIYLAQEVYENPALRSMSDIDILVKGQDVASSVTILTSLGYQPVRPFDLRSEFKFHRHLPAFVKPGALPVEVHNALQQPSDPYNIKLASLWHRAGESHLCNRPLTCLDPHDLLLYLCVNVAFHDLFRLGLRGLYDISAVIDHFHAHLDWEELYQRSLDWRSGNLVYITLSLAHRLLGANMPPEFLSRLAPPGFDEAVFQICTDFIFSEPNHTDTLVTPELDQLVRVANPLAKFRILLNRLFIPRGEIAWYYNVPPGSWKIYLCYPQRFKYLAERYYFIGKRLSHGDPQLVAVSEEVRAQENQRRQLVENLI